MRKRILSLFLALTLLVIPARAVGETARLLTKDGPVWLAVRGSGDAAEFVYSDNGGRTWIGIGLDVEWNGETDTAFLTTRG
ncbi:MAG TPA: hypothetical protein VN421_10065 [Pseudoflavonifractor sp.]|nr:hypothetical protein [Pseudoflavonifractor sp.]